MSGVTTLPVVGKVPTAVILGVGAVTLAAAAYWYLYMRGGAGPNPPPPGGSQNVNIAFRSTATSVAWVENPDGSRGPDLTTNFVQTTLQTGQVYKMMGQSFGANPYEVELGTDVPGYNLPQPPNPAPFDIILNGVNKGTFTNISIAALSSLPGWNGSTGVAQVATLELRAR